MEQAMNYQCEECGYSTDRIDDLESHLCMHSVERPFRCPYCSHASTRKSLLRSHVEMHEKRDGLPVPVELQVQPRMVHKCEFCDKTFELKMQLQQHEREHNRVCSYTCTICGREFAHHHNMIKHFNSH